MVVPDLCVDVELHVSYAPFHQPPGHQAAAGIRISRILADPVSIQGRLGFLVHVQGVCRFQLHAAGQLVTIDAGIKLQAVGTFSPMDLVDRAKQLPLQLGHAGWIRRFRVQVENRRSGTANSCSLVNGWQETALPALHGIDRQAKRIIQDHVGRQVLVLTSQGVDDPGRHRGASRKQPPGMDLEKSRFVVGVRIEHRADHGDVIHALCQVGHGVGDDGSAFSMLLERKGASHQSPGGLGRGDILCDPGEIGFTVVLVEFFFGIKQVHLAGPTIHE